MSDKEMELGTQPLNEVMEARNLSNHDLVEASTEGLTHKQVQKSRKGRRVTRNIQDKILAAIIKKTGEPFTCTDLFTYR